MKSRFCALVALNFAAIFSLAAATEINEPASFVSEVYRHLIESQSNNSSYSPPQDIYTERLSALFRQEARRAKGEVGCLDFDFWVNGQDWMLKDVTVTSKLLGADREIVIARFRNTGTPEEIHFDFRKSAGRWRLDDVESVKDTKWTLSKILMCPL